MKENLIKENKNESLVSVITPTFNSERFIKKTIESILSQSYKNVELIIVDDCSTDNTISIIKSFSDKRIVLIENKENMGAAYSRNIAIKHANGEYIAFLDGDDLWDSTKLEKQIAFMEINNFSFTYTNYDIIDESDNDKGVFYTGPKSISFKSFRRANYVGCLTVVYKKNICPGIEVPNDLYKRNDYALWLIISQKANCYLLNQILSHYRVRSGSISSGKKTRIFKHHIQLFMQVLSYNRVHAFLCSVRNIVFYFLKQIKYKKRKKQKVTL